MQTSERWDADPSSYKATKDKSLPSPYEVNFQEQIELDVLLPDDEEYAPNLEFIVMDKVGWLGGFVMPSQQIVCWGSMPLSGFYPRGEKPEEEEEAEEEEDAAARARREKAEKRKQFEDLVQALQRQGTVTAKEATKLINQFKSVQGKNSELEQAFDMYIQAPSDSAFIQRTEDFLLKAEKKAIQDMNKQNEKVAKEEEEKKKKIAAEAEKKAKDERAKENARKLKEENDASAAAAKEEAKAEKDRVKEEKAAEKQRLKEEKAAEKERKAAEKAAAKNAAKAAAAGPNARGVEGGKPKEEEVDGEVVTDEEGLSGADAPDQEDMEAGSPELGEGADDGDGTHGRDAGEAGPGGGSPGPAADGAHEAGPDAPGPHGEDEEGLENGAGVDGVELEMQDHGEAPLEEGGLDEGDKGPSDNQEMGNNPNIAAHQPPQTDQGGTSGDVVSGGDMPMTGGGEIGAPADDGEMYAAIRPEDDEEPDKQEVVDTPDGKPTGKISQKLAH